MSNNTLAQGRSWYTEHDFAFSPDPTSDLFRTSKRWAIELEREINREGGAITPLKDFTFTQPSPRTYKVGVSVTDVIVSVTPKEFTITHIGVPSGMFPGVVDGSIILGGTPTTMQEKQITITLSAVGYNPAVIYCGVSVALQDMHITPAKPATMNLGWSEELNKRQVVTVDNSDFIPTAVGLPYGLGVIRDINKVALSGRTAVSGTHTASITLNAMHCAPVTFPLTIIVAPDTRIPITITPEQIADVTITYGEPVDILLTTVDQDGIEFDSARLPAGLTYIFNGKTIRLTGTPTEVATITADIGLGMTGYVNLWPSFNLTITPASIVVTPDVLPEINDLVVGVPVNILLATTTSSERLFDNTLTAIPHLSVVVENNEIRIIGTPIDIGVFEGTYELYAKGHDSKFITFKCTVGAAP